MKKHRRRKRTRKKTDHYNDRNNIDDNDHNNIHDNIGNTEINISNVPFFVGEKTLLSQGLSFFGPDLRRSKGSVY